MLLNVPVPSWEERGWRAVLFVPVKEKILGILRKFNLLPQPLKTNMRESYPNYYCLDKNQQYLVDISQVQSSCDLNGEANF